MLWSVYWAAHVTLSVPLFVKVSLIFKKSSWINEADAQPGTRPSTRLWSLPSPGLGGTWERCSWSYSPRRTEDWVRPRKPPLGPAAGSSVSPAPDSGFPHGRSCPWTFGRLMGGVRIPPWLRDQSPGCRGTRPETEPARTEGRGGRSRSWFLVRNSHLGILQRDRRRHGVRLYQNLHGNNEPEDAGFIYLTFSGTRSGRWTSSDIQMMFRKVLESCRGVRHPASVSTRRLDGETCRKQVNNQVDGKKYLPKSHFVSFRLSFPPTCC